jgi:hypothetical protein
LFKINKGGGKLKETHISLDEMKSINLINSLVNAPLDSKDSIDYGDLPSRVLPELGKLVFEEKINHE